MNEHSLVAVPKDELSSKIQAIKLKRSKWHAIPSSRRSTGVLGMHILGGMYTVADDGGEPLNPTHL